MPDAVFPPLRPAPPPGRSTLRAAALSRLLLGVALLLPGCAALPGSGPLASQIDEAEPEGELEGLVVPLTAEIAAVAEMPERFGFPPGFLEAEEIDPEQLGVGDRVDITIFETGETALFSLGQGSTTLPATPVDAQGNVYVPFLGAVRAAGATPGTLRERIRAALEPLTASPQVDVRLVEPISRTLTVTGAVAQPGPYVVDRGATRLTPLLALAGGSRLDPERTEVTLRRDGLEGAETLADIYEEAALDVAVRPGDLILLDELRARYTVLGATSRQAQIPFPTRNFDLLSALGLAGGLSDFDADPRGVFLFRYERPQLADALLPGERPEDIPPGPGRPIVYRLDLTEPEAFFIAQQFEMRDDDAIYVANAPLTEIRKFVSLFSAAVSPVRTTATLPGTLSGAAGGL